MLQAQKQFGSLVVLRNKSAGSWKSLSPSSSRSSTPQRSATKLGSGELNSMSGIIRNSSGISRSHSSLQFLRASSPSAPTINGCSSKQEDQQGVSPSVVQLLFFLVTSMKLGRLVDMAISILRYQVQRMPFLLYFSFVRVLLGYHESHGSGLNGMAFHDPCQGPASTYSTEVFEAVQEVKKDDTTSSSQEARVVLTTFNDEDPDDYGFFADFEDDTPLHTPLVEDPLQARSRQSCRGSLCTLPESEEDD